MPVAGAPRAAIGPGETAASGRFAALRTALLAWRAEGRWVDVALEGVSMDPIIRHGATLRVRFGPAAASSGAPPGSDLKVGDVVIYAAPARLIAHRVIRVGRRGRRAGWVRVKGDPLTSRRATWIRAEEILGRVAAVTQPDGARLYLNTPAGRLLNRAAALVSMAAGAVDARLPRRAHAAPSRSLTARALAALNTLHAAAARSREADGGRNLSAEERFLVAACRPAPEPRDIIRLAAGGPEMLDWDRVRELAVSLGLAPLLFRNLSGPLLRGEIPDRFLSPLGRASHISVYLSLQRREELLRILDLLAGEGIVPILLKGAALAFTVYKDPSLRTMNDLDLLLREEEIAKAALALESLSYRQLYRPSLADPGERAAFYGKHHHATPLIAPRGRAIVELHRHIASMGEDGSYDVDRIRARALPITIEGRAALVPSPADLVLHTCLHLSYSDRFVGKLRDLIDLHETISIHGDRIDWGVMLAEIPSEAAARCLYSCLDLTRRLYGTPVPADFLYELRRASRLGFVSVRLLRALARTVLFQGGASSGRNILTTASAKWCCDTLLRKAGWPSRLRALAVLLAEG